MMLPASSHFWFMIYYKCLRNHLEIIFLAFAQLMQVTDNICYSVITCYSLQIQQMPGITFHRLKATCPHQRIESARSHGHSWQSWMYLQYFPPAVQSVISYQVASIRVRITDYFGKFTMLMSRQKVLHIVTLHIISSLFFSV